MSSKFKDPKARELAKENWVRWSESKPELRRGVPDAACSWGLAVWRRRHLITCGIEEKVGEERLTV